MQQLPNNLRPPNQDYAAIQLEGAVGVRSSIANGASLRPLSPVRVGEEAGLVHTRGAVPEIRG